MRTLAIDQSIASSGFVVVSNGDIIQGGVITTKRDPKKDPYNAARLEEIFDDVEALILKYGPERMVLEKFFANPRNAHASGVIPEVRGVLKIVARKNKLPLEEFAAQSVRKGLTGNGRADKKDVKEAVFKKYPGLKGMLAAAKFNKAKTEDITDAAALAAHAARTP